MKESKSWCLLVFYSSRGFGWNIVFMHRVKEWHHRVSRQIYLDQPYRGESAKGLKIKRFGVSNDIRTLWLGNQVESIYSNDRELAEAVKKLGSG